MEPVRSEEVRIPRRAREALARREEVVVFNRERPTFVILNSEDHAAANRPLRRGRPLREALALLANAASPDSAFAKDMEKVLGSIGPSPADPWARS